MARALPLLRFGTTSDMLTWQRRFTAIASLTTMASMFWYPLLAFIGVFGGALLCFPVTRRMPGRWLLITAVYLAVDDEVLIGTSHLARVNWFAPNWFAKLASILLALASMKVFRLSRDEVGLRWPQRGSWGWISAALTLAVIWGYAGVQGMYRQPFTLESLFYQASMPGLAEELVYRGVAYAMLVRAFRDGRSRVAPFAAVLISSFCFGLGHLEPPVVLPPPGWLVTMLRFAALQAGAKALLGAMLAVLRWRSGSLLGPVLAHGAYNVAGTVSLAGVRSP